MLTLTVEENEVIDVGGNKIFFRRKKEGSMIRILIYFDFPKDVIIERTGSYSEHRQSKNAKDVKRKKLVYTKNTEKGV